MLALVGCGKKKAAPPPAASAATTPNDAMHAGLLPVPAKIELTAAKLDAFLKFHQDRTALYHQLLVKMTEVSRADAGVTDADRAQMLRATGQAEAKAREAAGLTVEEIRSIEAMVRPILQQRRMAQVLLGGTSAPSASKAPLTLEQKNARDLLEERAQFGNQNVDLIVAKADALLAAEQAWANVLAGKL